MNRAEPFSILPPVLPAPACALMITNHRRFDEHVPAPVRSPIGAQSRKGGLFSSKNWLLLLGN
jgi:hypothetical protein